MSLTLNMVGGGGGGLSATDALLRVQAPAGSTVTITKGTTTKTDLGHENADDNSVYDYYFIIHQSQFDSVNPWTVTATLGSNIATSTVIINLSDEYDLVLSYHVPAEYQEVEYLESSGTQYINSNYNPQVGDIVEILLQATAVVNDNTAFGVSSTNNNRCVLSNRSDVALQYIWGNNSYKNVTITPMTNTDYEVLLSSDLYVNGTSYGSIAFTAQTRPLYIFAENSVGSVTRYGKIRIKSFKITNSSNVVQREFYPCYRKSDSVAGLYDHENGVFYTNAGSGSFVVGGDI